MYENVQWYQLCSEAVLIRPPPRLSDGKDSSWRVVKQSVGALHRHSQLREANSRATTTSRPLRERVHVNSLWDLSKGVLFKR